jgi:hypothetical protein
MAISGNSSRRIRKEDLKVSLETEPGWQSGEEQLPSAGSTVLCAEGMAEVVKLLGKTGNGTRLLELKLLDGTRQPFFAESSNVRVPPPEDAK